MESVILAPAPAFFAKAAEMLQLQVAGIDLTSHLRSLLHEKRGLVLELEERAAIAAAGERILDHGHLFLHYGYGLIQHCLH